VALPPAPHTARENVVDDVHGIKTADPYRWLEADTTERVRDWTDRQNARTRAVLDPLPQRATFARRLRELLSVGLLSTPRPIAGRLFHTRREGEQKQAVLYVRDGLRLVLPVAGRPLRRIRSLARGR
jgi:prolyl oligopeptidase